MRSLYVFIILFHFISILSGQNTDNYRFLDKVECEIVKIDSIDNFYLIYAQSSSGQYKILSRKIPIECRNIFLGDTYELDIYEMYPVPINYLDMNMIVGAGTIIKIDWGNNIYKCYQIWSLCYEKDDNKIREYQQQVQQEENFENQMYYIWYFYDQKISKNKIIKKPFNVFFKNQIETANNAFFKNKINIPVYSSPNKDSIIKILSYMSSEHFVIKVYYHDKDFYFIKAFSNGDSKNPLYGWIEKKYLILNKKVD